MTCQHLRNHVHVHSELVQEPGESGGLVEDNNGCHPLYGICLQFDAASPTQMRGTKDQFKDTAEI